MMFSARAGSAWHRSGVRLLLLLLAALLLSGCAARLNSASEAFYAERPDEALSILNKGDGQGRRNQLLFFMERGVVLHQLGRYEESAQVLLEAAQFLRENDYLSVSEQAGSLVTSEWLVRYKGEYAERLWVHSYLMMNFLLLGQYDSAYVEAKQSLDLLGRWPDALKDDHFTRALIALCFAQAGEDNDAYLTYKQLAADLPELTPVAADLLRLAGRLGIADELELYREQLPKPLPQGEAELVLFIASGRIPVKQPGNLVLPPSIRFSFPYYPEYVAPPLRVRFLPADLPTLPPLSTDLAAVARRSLHERKLSLIAKETARVVAKEATAQAVGRNNGELAEVLVRVGLFILEEPDTRCWRTLPGRLALLRIPLSAGTHRLRLQLSSAGPFTTREIALPEISLQAGERRFHALRF